MGTYCPYCGHRVPILWDDFWALFWVSEFVFFLYVVDYIFVFLYNALWWFDDTSIEIMILLWYIFVNIFESVVLQSVMYQQFICKQWYFETFLKEKTFMCEDKGMGESASFVSGSSHHFPEKYRKLGKNSWKFVCLISFSYFMHP